ncbi:Hypothetical protein SRAE_2000128000 [Strongyloides ratti]|uniref:Uncharacterized protein n=1 Tax=Strongyloides ratti TaxID=34506 RepID=A0A090LA49_STRRB|nr:Hypothetical protein SRAE_2000128000 [Strongyloides ratti]CEF66612.1 Hypothetical protein SRAE_2000128000 [Strongyloides ratti]
MNGKICNNIEESPDMILFTIPYVDIPGDKKDKEEFDKNYKNLCGEVIKKLGFPSSWRSTYYNTWDSLLSFNIFDKSNLIYSIKEHQKKGKQSIYIVPILDLLPSFNTATIIPNVSIQKNVKFLKPSNDVEFLSKHFTEIIERELLN